MDVAAAEGEADDDQAKRGSSDADVAAASDVVGALSELAVELSRCRAAQEESERALSS